MYQHTKHYHLGCGEALQAVHSTIIKKRKFINNIKQLLDKQTVKLKKTD